MAESGTPQTTEQSTEVRESVSHSGEEVSWRQARVPGRMVDFMYRRHRQENTEQSRDPLYVLPLGLSEAWIEANLPTDQIEEIGRLATDVFEAPETAQTWLQTPNIATDNKAPISLLGTQEGFDRLKTLLMRIEYGLLA